MHLSSESSIICRVEAKKSFVKVFEYLIFDQEGEFEVGNRFRRELRLLKPSDESCVVLSISILGEGACWYNISPL